MVLSQFWQKVNFAKCSIYNFSHVFLWGVGGEEGATKLSQNLPKVPPKGWQNFMSSKFEKNHNTTYITLYSIKKFQACAYILTALG